MATQNGIIKINGQLGDFIFYKRGNKDVVRQKATVYEQSENSKKSSIDFGSASRNAAYIRKAFAPLVKLYAYNDLMNRLNKRLNEVFKTIPATHLGNKKLIDGNISLIAGFEFNTTTSFYSLYYKTPDLLIEPGFVKLSLPKSNLKNLIKPIPKATKAVLQVMIFNFDLTGDQYEIFKLSDLEISLHDLVFPGAKLSIPITQQGDKALMVAAGISYYNRENQSADRRYYACKITHALHLRDGVVVDFIEDVKEKSYVVEEQEQNGLCWEMG